MNALKASRRIMDDQHPLRLPSYPIGGVAALEKALVKGDCLDAELEEEAWTLTLDAHVLGRNWRFNEHEGGAVKIHHLVAYIDHDCYGVLNTFAYTRHTGLADDWGAGGGYFAYSLKYLGWLRVALRRSWLYHRLQGNYGRKRFRG